MEFNNRLLLVSPPSVFLQEPAFVPHLGLLYVSAALRNAPWDAEREPKTRYLELADLTPRQALSSLVSEVQRWQPRFVGFSATTPQYPEVEKLAMEVRKASSKLSILIGGAHATNYQNSVETSGLFEHIFVGEAEVEIVKFWNHYISDSTTALYRAEAAVDVDSIGIPDWEIAGLDITRYSASIDRRRALPILTSRGCDFSCAFCERQPKGKRRERSIHNVTAEIEMLIAKGIEAFIFYDCCAVVGKARALQLRDAFQKVAKKHGDLIWRGFLRTDCVTEELLELLRESRCQELGFGVESGSDEILKNIGKASCDRTQSTLAIRLCRTVGIRSKAFLVVGFPGETKKTVDETISWVTEAMPDSIDVSLFTPYQGSHISRHPDEYGVVLYPQDRDFSQMYYKGKDDRDQASFVATRRRIGAKGLSRQQVLEQYHRLREFKKNYNDLVSSARSVTDGEEMRPEALEVYRILSNLVIHEGELIWRQLGLFISSSSLLVVALGFLMSLVDARPFILIVASLGILTSVVWCTIYMRSWYNQKIWFFLARRHELILRHAHAFSDGALIRQGAQVNDFTERSWRLGRLQRIPIIRWVVLWSVGFLLFWIAVLVMTLAFPDLLGSGTVTLPRLLSPPTPIP